MGESALAVSGHRSFTFTLFPLPSSLVRPPTKNNEPAAGRALYGKGGIRTLDTGFARITV